MDHTAEYALGTYVVDGQYLTTITRMVIRISYDSDDDTDEHYDHDIDNYTAAGAALGA